MKNISAQIQEAANALQEGNHSKADRLCRQILAKDSKNQIANQILGILLLQKGFFKESVSCFDEVLKVDNKQVKVWSNRSLALSGLKKFKEAHDSVDRAITLDNQFAESWYNKATIYIKQEQLQKAIENLDRLIQLKPEHHLAIFLKSDL